MIASKLPFVGRSIFPQMTALANQYGAINLAQGFPGFGADTKGLELICDYTMRGMNQYAPLTGLVSLKEKISEKIAARGGRVYHPESEICITAGATQALYSVLSAIVFEGDEVVVIEPAFDSYVPAILLNKGVPVRSEMMPGNYAIDWEDVKSKVTEKTKCIIVNTPHNPTGTVWSQSDLSGLRRALEGSDAFVLSDEVYEHLVFDGREHLSIANETDLAERAFVIYSFGKTYHVTGWRGGYVCAPKALMKEVVKCHQFQVYAANTPFQYALSDYSDHKEAYLHLNQFFQEKRDFFIQAISGSKFKAISPEGTYFALLDYSNISDQDDRDFANYLTIHHKVAAIPISVFFERKRQDQILRFCFAKENEELEQAAALLHKV